MVLTSTWRCRFELGWTSTTMIIVMVSSRLYWSALWPLRGRPPSTPILAPASVPPTAAIVGVALILPVLVISVGPTGWLICILIFLRRPTSRVTIEVRRLTGRAVPVFCSVRFSRRPIRGLVVFVGRSLWGTISWPLIVCHFSKLLLNRLPGGRLD